MRGNRVKGSSTLVSLRPGIEESNNETSNHKNTRSQEQVISKVVTHFSIVVVLTEVDDSISNGEQGKSNNKGKEDIPFEKTKSRHTIPCGLSHRGRRSGFKEAQSKDDKKTDRESEQDCTSDIVTRFNFIIITIGIVFTHSFTVIDEGMDKRSEEESKNSDVNLLERPNTFYRTVRISMRRLGTSVEVQPKTTRNDDGNHGNSNLSELGVILFCVCGKKGEAE